MHSWTLVPEGSTVERAPRSDAINYLAKRLGLNLTLSCADNSDPRHELALLALDIGARLLWLHERIAQVTQTGALDLAELNKYARERRCSQALPDWAALTDELPRHVARVQELEETLNLVDAAYRAACARVQELEETLNLVDAAYRAAWRNPAVQAAPLRDPVDVDIPDDLKASAPRTFYAGGPGMNSTNAASGTTGSC